MTTRVTLKDVAARAGVSISTVSYALNDASTVQLAEETRARVRRIADELGYLPNGMARALQARSSRAIGVVLTMPLTIPRYAAIVEGASAGLAARGFRLSVVADPTGQTYLDDCRSGLLDGLVFVGHDDESVPADMADAVRRHDIPFVALDCGSGGTSVPYSTVDFDYPAGARQMVEHLVAQGTRTLLYTRPDVAARSERLREAAVVAALTAHPDVTLHVVPTGLTDTPPERQDRDPGAVLAERLDAALGQVLRGRADASRTAVLCSWGPDSEHAYRVARRHDAGIEVAALAAGPLDENAWPGLCCSRLPLQEAGRECARLVVAALDPDAGHEHVLLAPTLSGTAPTTEAAAPAARSTRSDEGERP
ncbi:LacI family DNA-binding transcriptional regulator [Isoptericola sp. BMS4]|uniref:LacI family DNA-binding transcriptional regulator n=1 Tax=Isoptericola sp. BMS4 TaxID=2527875 RepID=UPI00142481B5|nr:LacI family DNA-binding transcriptional regulator [Isoptericola sp. BMS4]